jgi:3-deoxy-7-phosphoheptulonate synthase
MNLDFRQKLPIPAEIKKEYPVPDKISQLKKQRDWELKNILEGKDDRFIVIVGPCSADNEDSVLEYLSKLGKLNIELQDKLFIIPRVYTNKPRTTGEGYKGLIHQPDPQKKPDTLKGLLAVRQLHIKAVEVSGMTCADEMLYPENYRYLNDILSYVAIGARSVENQQHRLTASGMDIPVGMKNPTSGAFPIMLNSILAAQKSHNFIYRGWDVVSQGNPYAHAIVRGSVNKYGVAYPNYHYEDLDNLLKDYREKGLKFPACIVDANHANSNKLYKEQIRIVKEVLHTRSLSTELKDFVKGVMIESYLVEGCQKIDSDNVFGKSITDPCLGWEDTEQLLRDIAARV